MSREARRIWPIRLAAGLDVEGRRARQWPVPHRTGRTADPSARPTSRQDALSRISENCSKSIAPVCFSPSMMKVGVASTSSAALFF